MKFPTFLNTALRSLGTAVEKLQKQAEAVSQPFFWVNTKICRQTFILRAVLKNKWLTFAYSRVLNRRCAVLFSKNIGVNTKTNLKKLEDQGGLVNMAFPHRCNNGIILLWSKEEKLKTRVKYKTCQTFLLRNLIAMEKHRVKSRLCRIQDTRLLLSTKEYSTHIHLCHAL